VAAVIALADRFGRVATDLRVSFEQARWRP